MEASCLSILEERFQFLFEADLIQEICSQSEIHQMPAQKQIIGIGDELNFLPIVLSGSIKVMTEDKQGEELLLYYLESGDTCAVTLNCCSKKTRSKILAFTESESELLFINMNKFEDWMIKYSSWRNFIIESYNSRLDEMIMAIDNIVFNSMEDRIKKYLQDKVWIVRDKTFSISHADIANDLHSSRVVVSRIMKKLEKEGFLIQGRNKVELK